MLATKKQILKRAMILKEIADLPLCYAGNPILRHRCPKVFVNKIKSKDIKRVACKLINTLKKYRKITGVSRGLAAPQIGERIRMIVVWGFQDDKPRVMINPKITWRSKELAVYPEVCISTLEIMLDVIRPYQVKIEYIDLNGKKHQEMLNPENSRLIQHEIDHLDGILFLDRGDLESIRFVFDIEKTVKKGEFKLVKI